jgi:hypothetical protein
MVALVKKPTKKITLKQRIEKILKQKAGEIVSYDNIRDKIPKTTDDDKINTVLNSLEESGKIYISTRGIMWIENKSAKLKQAIKGGRKL